MAAPLTSFRALPRGERRKAALLSSWFFVTTTTLWLLKPLRSASLLAHLGAEELPYVRLGAVVVVAIVVAAYSHAARRASRLAIASGANLLFSAVLLVFWASLVGFGEALATQRWFVWAVFILVDVYSTVMIGIFWTYANDVVSREEADRLYAPIGLGGIVGGIVGGAVVDSLVGALGSVNLLLVCAGLGVATASLVRLSEGLLRPAPRVIEHGRARAKPLEAALEGARQVGRSRYLRLIVAVVISYEFAAAMTDFVVNVVFERAFASEDEIARMFGRLGWIVSATALVSQVVLVPALLPRKRIALLVPPVAMGLAVAGLAVAPVVALAIAMSAADRGLNYSLHQATKETLYVPLSDAQRYEGKAFVDMFADRLGKALSALSLIGVIAIAGMSIPVSLAVALVAIAVWIAGAHGLGSSYGAQLRSSELASSEVGADDVRVGA